MPSTSPQDPELSKEIASAMAATQLTFSDGSCSSSDSTDGPISRRARRLAIAIASKRVAGAHAIGALDDGKQCRGTLHTHIQLFPSTASLHSGSHSPDRKHRVIIIDDDDDVVAPMDSTNHMITGPGNSQSPPPINNEPAGPGNSQSPPPINNEPDQKTDNDNMPALLSDSDSDSDDSSDSGSSLLDFIDTAEPSLTLLQEKTLMRFFPITCKKNIANGV